MSRKRGTDGRFKTSGGSLTGGTGDVKPQLMTVALPAPSGINDYSVLEFAIPRIIMGARDSATVMEILKVYFYVGLDNLADSSYTMGAFLSTSLIRVQDSTANVATLASDMINPTVFASVVSTVLTTTTGAVTYTMPITIDLTDNNGNGILIATDKIFYTQGMTANILVSTGVVKILYRMVNIGITEYVGIVQSQIV